MKPNNDIITINPDLLIWARERINMSFEEAAKLAGKETIQIKKWESGDEKPSLAQLEKLAYKVYKLPLAVFFLPIPPDEPPLNQQFRTISPKELKELPYQFIQLANEAQYFQEVLKELYNDVNPVQSPIFNTIKVNSRNLKNSAEKIRGLLGINKQLQTGFKNDYEAYGFYRNTLENSGVFVFQQTLQDFCRGYSMIDDEFPVIIINSSELSYKGRIFTLFHELSHLLFHTGGITRSDFYSKHKIEVACNKLSSLILLSEADLISEDIVNKSHTPVWSDADLKYLSERFQLSQEFILRKLLDLGKSSPEFYAYKRKQWEKMVKTKKESSGGTFYNNALAKLGKNYTRSVLQGFYDGRITDQNVSDFLGIKINQIPEFEKRVYA